mgnify:CR=1 FL=1
MNGLLPADTYIVKNNTILNNESRLILVKLYQPIIGTVAVNLYFSLWSNLDVSQIISVAYTHHNLMAMMRIKLDDILEAREKLEAIGLLKTYVKKGSVNNYIYELYSPLEPYEFFDNPILATTLESNIGKNEYNKILNFFTIPQINLKEYENISKTFSETFETTNSLNVEATDDLRRVKQVDLIVDEKISLNNLLELIPNEILNHRTVTKEIKKLIYNLAYIYDFKEDELAELISNSINDKKMIDKNLLREHCRNYYTFEHNDKPTLIYKNQPEFLRQHLSDTSKKSKQIHVFETTSPYDFLTGKNKGATPEKSDLLLIENLMLDYELNPGVVNVLIDYVLRINNNKLTRNFVLKIASQWKRSNIKTASEAMNICKKEIQTKKQTNVKKIKSETKPEWFNKNIAETNASEDDIKALEEKMKSIV